MSGRWIARSAYDAPGIDGNVFIAGDEPLTAGEFAEVEISKTMTYDVYGRPLAAARRR